MHISLESQSIQEQIVLQVQQDFRIRLKYLCLWRRLHILKKKKMQRLHINYQYPPLNFTFSFFVPSSQPADNFQCQSGRY